MHAETRRTKGEEGFSRKQNCTSKGPAGNKSFSFNRLIMTSSPNSNTEKESQNLHTLSLSNHLSPLTNDQEQEPQNTTKGHTAPPTSHTLHLLSTTCCLCCSWMSSSHNYLLIIMQPVIHIPHPHPVSHPFLFIPHHIRTTSSPFRWLTFAIIHWPVNLKTVIMTLAYCNWFHPKLHINPFSLLLLLLVPNSTLGAPQ